MYLDVYMVSSARCCNYRAYCWLHSTRNFCTTTIFHGVHYLPATRVQQVHTHRTHLGPHGNKRERRLFLLFWLVCELLPPLWRKCGLKVTRSVLLSATAFKIFTNILFILRLDDAVIITFGGDGRPGESIASPMLFAVATANTAWTLMGWSLQRSITPNNCYL